MKKLIILIVILLIVGAYFIKSYNNLNLKEAKDLQTFIKVYSGWIYDLLINVKDVTGYVAKKEWLPKNSSVNNSAD